jgi:zinc protease
VSTALAPTRVQLDNGAVVLVKETRKTPAVAIQLAIRTGSIGDPSDVPGAMHLLGRVIDRGTATRSAAEISEELDGRGISLTISVTRHLVSISCACLASDFEAVFGLLADIISAPTVPPDELETRKGEVITAIRQDEDNPAVRAVEGLMMDLYGDQHPYGRRVKGSVGAVDGITRDRLRALHTARFAPSEVIAIVVCDVETSSVLMSGST